MLKTSTPLGMLFVASSFACSGGTAQPQDPPKSSLADAPAAVLPAVYVGRVKTLLVGLPPTDEEIARVVADPAALRDLVARWMRLPQYDAKMLQFFGQAFQQTDVQAEDLTPQSAGADPVASCSTPGALLLANLRESFARTAMEMARTDAPFNTTASTTRFMMTVPLMMYYALLDVVHVDDAGFAQDSVCGTPGHYNFKLEKRAGPIPIADTLNPNSANYLTWYEPDLNPGCAPEDPLILNASALACSAHSVSYALFRYLLGAGYTTYSTDGQRRVCQAPYAYKPRHVTRAEFDSWRSITIRTPRPNEPTTRFYDIETLRQTHELVLNVPRVGFFTTPSFLAQWGTNPSNQARVTINQTLIVGLGHAFDGSASIAPLSEAALDSAHSPHHSECFVCHQTLDPMRQFFRHDYTLAFHEQTDANQRDVPGMFAFAGVSRAGVSIYDLGQNMAAHPNFAAAWTQKLCTYANGRVCDTTDPVFIQLVTDFVGSGYRWNTLVNALFASSLVVHSDSYPVTKVAHLCALLANRLGVPDVCAQPAIERVLTSWPTDAYSRGSVSPVMANDPTVFYRAGLENICALLATQLVGESPSARFYSGEPDVAIGRLVHDLMGLGSTRDAAPSAILTRHYNAAISQGTDATTALQSTFVVACLSPAVAGVGQ